MRRKWKDWGEVFNHYLAKGLEHVMAAYMADQWEKRQQPKKTMEHISSPDCWCEPEQDHIDPNVFIHKERH